MMRSNILRVLWIIICSSMTIAATTHGTRYDWPDYVHIDYGAPAVWATNTLVTFTGPTNFWSIDLTLLIVDLIIWQTILLAGIVIIEIKHSSKK